jgi:hypothetical protein
MRERPRPPIFANVFRSGWPETLDTYNQKMEEYRHDRDEWVAEALEELLEAVRKLGPEKEYRAGQLRMRERAAQLIDEAGWADADGIRALEPEEREP